MIWLYYHDQRQDCLSALPQYCRSWVLNINLKKKTKLWFFNDERKNMTEIFILATKRLTLSKVVLTGNQISPTGKFTLSLEHLREKAVHAQLSFKAPHRLQQFEPISCLQNFWHNDFTYSDFGCLYAIRLQVLGHSVHRLKKVTHIFVNVICKWITRLLKMRARLDLVDILLYIFDMNKSSK